MLVAWHLLARLRQAGKEELSQNPSMPKPTRHCVDLACHRPCSTLPRGGPSFWSSSRRSAWQWATPRERQYGHGQTQVAKTRAWALWCTRGAVGTTHTLMPHQPSFDQLLHRQDSQINFLEMLAVLLFVTTFQNIICGTAAFVFIDNNSVLGSLLKGSSSAPEVNMLTGRIWLHSAECSWAPIWARVESAANIADGPSRRDFTHVESIGAELVAPVLPQWLSTLWILDCGDCP